MKRFLLFSLVFLLAATAIADTYQFLTFQTTDGTTASVSVEALTMSFSNDGKILIVSNGTEKQTMAVSNLEKMFFSTTNLSGIDEVTKPSDTHEVQVYSTSGVFFGTYRNQQSLKDVLPPGIYIAKSNGRTQKIAVR